MLSYNITKLHQNNNFHYAAIVNKHYYHLASGCIVIDCKKYPKLYPHMITPAERKQIQYNNRLKPWTLPGLYKKVLITLTIFTMPEMYLTSFHHISVRNTGTIHLTVKDIQSHSYMFLLRLM